MLTRAILALILTAGFGLQAGAPAQAQPFPQRPIKIVLPYTPGSPNDVVVRLIIPRLTTALGQSVVVENRPGGGTIIGTKTVATSDADGHTWLGASINFVVAPSLNPNAGYDPLKDFAPIASVASSPFILVVAPDLPVKTLQEFIAYAKANPGKLNFGFGQGTAPHMIGELLKASSGVDIASIPYKGGAQAVTDMLGGRIQMNIGTPATLVPLIRQGKLKALAVTSGTRSPDLPDVPTMAESGAPELALTYWMGLLAPAGTPPALIARINAEINEGLKSDEVKASMAKLGFEPGSGAPRDFAAFLAEEARRWAPIAKVGNIAAE
jgi:tripartite-type tricarboxylate transporter receptor subunit TctC